MKTLKASLSLMALMAVGALGVGAVYGQQAARPRPAVGPVGIAPPIQPDARSAQIIQQRQAVAAAVTPVTDAMLLNPPASEWLMWRRTYNVHGFSPLDQINRNNVRELQTVWSWQVAPNTVEDTPLEHDGVLYVYGAGDHIQALDATNGDLLWEYDRPPSPGSTRASVERNIALYQDKVIFGTADRHAVALDAKTGKVVWDQLFRRRENWAYDRRPNGGQRQGDHWHRGLRRRRLSHHRARCQ